MVAPWKKKTVDELAKDIKSATTTAIVSISGIPSKQFQLIRKKLKGQVKINIVRNNIIRLALEKAGVQPLVEEMKGPTGLLTTSLNPFKLSKLISSCKIKAPAKVGSIAPYDIIVPKGDTPFPAGPIIGDVQKAGIKAKIQGGKIVVTEDCLVVKQGKPVPAEAASILARLGITPMEIGLGLKAACEASVIYNADTLGIDDESTKARIAAAHLNALNLAFNANICTKETVKLMLQKAHAEAINLAYNAEIINKETIEFYLSKANAQASALSGRIPEAPKE